MTDGVKHRIRRTKSSIIDHKVEKLLKELYNRLSQIRSDAEVIYEGNIGSINGNDTYLFLIRSDNKLRGTVLFTEEGKDRYLVEATYVEKEHGYIYNLRFKFRGSIEDFIDEPGKVIDEILKVCTEPRNLVSIDRTIYSGIHRVIIAYDDYI